MTSNCKVKPKGEKERTLKNNPTTVDLSRDSEIALFAPKVMKMGKREFCD